MFITLMACYSDRVGIDLVVVLIPSCSFQAHIRCSYGGFLPVEPRDEAHPAKTLTSNSNKDASAGREEQMACTPTVGASKTRNALKKGPQLVSQQTFPIPGAGGINSGLDFAVLKEIVDVPMELLYSTPVTIQPRPQSPPGDTNVAVGSSPEEPMSHGPDLNQSLARYPQQEEIDSAELT